MKNHYNYRHWSRPLIFFFTSINYSELDKTLDKVSNKKLTRYLKSNDCQNDG